MTEEINPFKLIKAGHDPIQGIENPKTPLKYIAGARDKNIQKVTDEKGEGVLPEIKVREVTSN